LFAQGALVPELDGSSFHAVQPMGVCDPQTPAQGASPLDPDPLFFAPPKKRGNRAAAPHCARPRLRRGVPCGARKPAPARTRGVRSAHSAQTGWPSQKGCVPAARGPSCCAPRRRRGGGAAEYPTYQLTARCLLWLAHLPAESTSRGPAVGCWLLPAVCAAEQRRQGARVSQARIPSDSRSLSERRERSERSEFCAWAPCRAAQGTPARFWRAGASAVGPPFFSPLFFGGAKKRGSGCRG
jgi:hypothetical protein